MLSGLLTEQHTRVAELLEVLKLENSALKQNQTETLGQLSGRKEQLVKLIDSKERQRTALLKATGFENSKSGMEQLITRLGNAPQVIETWDQLIQDLAECKKINEVNGGAIELVKRHLQRAVTIIQGKSSTPALYTDDGQTSAQFSGQTIARA